MIKTALLKDNLLKYVDLGFLLRFVILFLLLYFTNQSFEAITNPPGLVYSPFFDHYLNYVHLVKLSILYIGQLIANAAGIHSDFLQDYTLRLTNGSAVKMYYECAGFGLISFWIAFITSHNTSWQRKVGWSITGIFAIWLINCFRFALILQVLNKDGQLGKGFDHHAVFNYSSYVAIFIMCWFFYRQDKKRLFGKQL